MRQAERLRWLCRVWPFFAVAMLLWNANAVLSAALPFATAAAVLLVGFNRTTRQDPEISTRPGYLLLSGGVLAAVCAGPVSYTHLDVYKRQFVFFAFKGQ